MCIILSRWRTVRQPEYTNVVINSISFIVSEWALLHAYHHLWWHHFCDCDIWRNVLRKHDSSFLHRHSRKIEQKNGFGWISLFLMRKNRERILHEYFTLHYIVSLYIKLRWFKAFLLLGPELWKRKHMCGNWKWKRMLC